MEKKNNMFYLLDMYEKIKGKNLRLSPLSFKRMEGRLKNVKEMGKK